MVALSSCLPIFLLIISTVSSQHFFVITRSHNQGCEEKCQETYENVDEVSSCSRGCRFASLGQSDPLNDSMSEEEGSGSCGSSCNASYITQELFSSCANGCKFMKPFIDMKSQMLHSPMSFLFGNRSPFGSLPHISRLMPYKNDDEDEEGDDTSLFSPVGRMGDIFKHMQNIMTSALNKVSMNMPMSSEGSGKMVIIKSGPGYQETKTYNIGPGLRLDETFAKSDVGLEDNLIANQKLDDDVSSGYNLEFLNSLLHNKLSAEDEPHLPQTGLKSRYQYGGLCPEDLSKLSWSDWKYCTKITRKMIFLPIGLIVCLLIVLAMAGLAACRQAASLRKGEIVKEPHTTKAALAKAKEAEANGIRVDLPVLDAPPPYEDVSNLTVTLVPAVHETTKEKSSPA